MIQVVTFRILVVNVAILELNCGNCFQYIFSNFYSGNFLDPITSRNKFLDALKINIFCFYSAYNKIFLVTINESSWRLSGRSS